MNRIIFLHSYSKVWLVVSALFLCVGSNVPTLTYAAEPVPALPQVFIDTTWNPPTGGATWAAHTSADLTADLTAAQPGDIIVLDAGVTYTGNFTLPTKANPGGKWIYIESSALASLPAPGTRIDPSDVANMPTITTINASSPITVAPGADHWRLVGLEVTSASTTPWCNGCNDFTYFLIYADQAQNGALITTNNITVDRCYIHGTPTQDVREGVTMNAINMAVIDSYISDIHQSTDDSQAIAAYYTPGPLKIVDNYLSATTENVLFGGAGGYNDPYVPSDIEIRNNWFFKPLAWEKCGAQGTVPPGEQLADGSTCPAGVSNQWDEKNSLEFKSAQRVIVTGNIMQNTWLSGQTGTSVLFTIRTSQSGNIAVVDDITFENNFLTNVDAGINTLEQDNDCDAQDGYPQCTNPGESLRVKIANNLMLLRPSLDTYQHGGIRFDGGNATDAGLTDYVFQHNTVLMSDLSTLWASIAFSLPQLSWGCSPPLGFSATHNIWVLDNALLQQPDGDCGLVSGSGVTGLGDYMGDPSPLDPRFLGSVLFAPGGRAYSYPANNDPTTTQLTFNPQWLLLTPDWSTHTSDGTQAGITPWMADVSFTFTPTTPSINQAVQFTDTTTGNPSPTGWSWDFGDNSTSNLQNPSHTYTTAGIYTVILTVLTANGESQTTHDVTVTGSSGGGNTTSFTFSPSSPAMNQAVQFTDTSTDKPTSWLWNFGDSASGQANTSTLQNPTHTYAASGNYTVTLTAGNGSINSGGQASQMVTVSSGSSGVTKKGGGAFDWFSLLMLLGFVSYSRWRCSWVSP